MMKTKPAKKFTKVIICVATMFVVAACTNRATQLYEQAYGEIEKGHFRIAVDLLEKSASVEDNNFNKNKYLSEAARIIRFEIQEYERALRILRRVIMDSDDEIQRIQAQEAICEIYLENLQDYTNALKELQVLEPLLKDTKKKERSKLRIAQTLYLTGSYEQALQEIEAAQKYIQYYDFNYQKLKAEIFVAQKKYKEAIAAYDNIRVKNPEFYQKENLYIATSIVYEEAEQFVDALNFLTKYQDLVSDKSYLELRMKRLKEKIVNKPLSRGIRK